MKPQPTPTISCLGDGGENSITREKHYRASLRQLLINSEAVLLTTSALCIGTTYYVASDGSDFADGLSLETPWQRIQKAADTMVAGDTVQIRGGTYIERILPRNGGSEGMPITYQAYLDEEVVIQGKNVSEWDSCIRIYSLSAKDVNYKEKKKPQNNACTKVGATHQ